MLKLLISSLFLIPACAYSQSVTFNIAAATLKDSGGAPIPEGSGLIVLVADTTANGFSGPSAANFASGDDLELKRWQISTGSGNGVLSDTTGSLNFSLDGTGQWGPNDPVKIYWYPSLTLGSASPGAGTSYGEYRDPATTLAGARDGSDLWLTPSSGGLVSLKFLTSEVGGANPTAPDFVNGDANLTVVPEPATFGSVFGALCLAVGVITRKSRILSLVANG